MEAKLALVDSIECIKEKLTSQEYKEILENLAKVNVEQESEQESEQVHRRNSPSSPPLIKISIELSTFLGIPEDILISRRDVYNGIVKYVKDHDLQKPENKRVIDLTKPGGEPLRTLLKVPENAELTFFNLQRYLVMFHYYFD